jgi:N-acetylmuramoyl-L-alanine amidase
MTNKWKIHIVSHRSRIAISLIFVALGALLVLYGGVKYLAPARPTSAPVGNRVVLIDPGHGGIDSGASAGTVYEKDLNLQIAKILKNYIEENGGICYMTRDCDTNTADPNRDKSTSQKMSDLKMRKKMIDDCKADIFISIHVNKFEQSKYSGFQTFYNGSLAESKELGEKIQASVKDVLKDGNTRVAKDAGSGIFVLKGNKIPSVLVECGFLSNENECKKLQNPEYQRKLAWGIYLGIIGFITH